MFKTVISHLFYWHTPKCLQNAVKWHNLHLTSPCPPFFFSKDENAWGPFVWKHRECGAGWHCPQEPLLWQSTPQSCFRGEWLEPLHPAFQLSRSLSDAVIISPLALQCLSPFSLPFCPSRCQLCPCTVPFLPGSTTPFTFLLLITPSFRKQNSSVPNMSF